MKTCSYCGGKYPDDTPECPIDHTPISAHSSPPASSPHRSEFEFAPLSPEQRQQALVTLVKCGTLAAADLIACQLRAAGIETFIPDEMLMQTIGFNLNTYGYVRVQISPKDYDAAKAILSN
jgi:hypothetical protein